jgi:hypothetical protein
VRTDVALRLLEWVESDEALDRAAEQADPSRVVHDGPDQLHARKLNSN